MKDLHAQFTLDDVDDDLGPYLFLRAHADRGDLHLVKRDIGRAVPRSVLPDRHRLVRSIDAGPVWDVVSEIDDVLVLLRAWRHKTEVWATATSSDRADLVLAEIQERVPPPTSGGRVDVQFTDRQAGERYLPVDVRAWADIRHLYTPDVQAALDELLAHRPTVESARRLLLWYGEPGTGKTTAIRALLDAWRDFADGVIVTDPAELLSDGRYLRRILLEQHEEDRWQLVVLEDAETLLHKGGGGQLAKLLNLADGLLGQGLRCLFLITTNEPLHQVHPALVRPGRCLARVEFGRLTAAQAGAALGRPADKDMTLAEVMAARPVSVQTAPPQVGQYL